MGPKQSLNSDLMWCCMQNLAATGHACTVLGGLVCAFAIVSALSALALLAPLVK